MGTIATVTGGAGWNLTALAQKKVPNPGEFVRADGGLGVPITIEGQNINGGVTYTGLVAGARIRHLGGVAQVLATTVAGADVTVQLGTDAFAIPTSTAAQVQASVAAAAAGIVSAAATGTGLGGAGGNPQWIALTEGPAGSVRPAFQALTDDVAFIADHAAGWEAYGACLYVLNSDKTKINLPPHRGLQTRMTTPGTAQLSNGGVANDTWYYVYALVQTDTINAYERVANAPPDLYLAHRDGAENKRYLGCVRTDGAGVFRPVRAWRGEYLYQANFLLTTTEQAGFTTLDFQGQVPPTARMVCLDVEMASDNAVVSSVQLRTTGETAVEELSCVAGGKAWYRRFWIACTASQGVQYLTTNAGHNTFAIRLAGFREGF